MQDDDSTKETSPMIAMRIPSIHSKIDQFTRPIQHAMIALVLRSASPLRGVAQDGHSHTAPPEQELTAEQQSKQSALIKIARQHTERFVNWHPNVSCQAFGG
jgi:hypothetical protein